MYLRRVPEVERLVPKALTPALVIGLGTIRSTLGLRFHALPDADFQEVSRAVDEMEAERFDQALDHSSRKRDSSLCCQGSERSL